MAMEFQSNDDISWGLSDSAKRSEAFLSLSSGNHDRRMVDLWVLTSNNGKTGQEKVLEVVVPDGRGPPSLATPGLS
ncbi:hypothetical protein N7491_003791 [Penicillium cf. griseofulvum]|uniref:Uncharacterized protein n=1 Tax=Penicillium cf. griseofulvum TaxID=2972120 RepID=A0A9W9T148_9EURO|nr:hypothetical protein N7472_002027 [Penicillium cf. griseofulvum]KAJ5437240.1 hypothetical protein N7445_005784 [Penicillium cf. griseofulvum]KAJ5441385.1 hypothetical protein N7491_003791 [Penicillium cf. griseofulvum]